MEFDEDLAAIHGYLCSDGYITSHKEGKKRLYHIGFRNTNTILLEDFQKRFERYFGLKPYITKDGRCRIQNKNIHTKLAELFCVTSHDWKLPKMSKKNLKYWLRAYYDSDGWVVGKKGNAGRLIGLESVNESGLEEIKKALLRLKITSNPIKKKKNRPLFRMTITGQHNFIKFSKYIGLLHPSKRQKLNRLMQSYQNYNKA